MANNCLLTKLKGTVNNDNLPIYETLVVEHIAVTTTADLFILYANDGISMIIDSDEITEVFDVSNNAHALPWTINFTVASNYSQIVRVKQKGKLKIKSKYALNGIDSLNKGNIHVSLLSDFAYKNSPVSANYLKLGNSNVSGDISILAENTPALQEINLQECSKVTGTASDLGAFTNATVLTILHTQITGSIEEFVAAQIAHGRTSVDDANNIYSNAILGQLTFGGSTHVASYGRITWESASKIAVYTGAEALTNCTHVYCKGYTQEEATAKWPDLDVLRVDA